MYSFIFIKIIIKVDYYYYNYYYFTVQKMINNFIKKNQKPKANRYYTFF